MDSLDHTQIVFEFLDRLIILSQSRMYSRALRMLLKPVGYSVEIHNADIIGSLSP